MVNEFKLPDVGEGLTEAELVSWHVKVGDQIKVNDVVCDIETAKSVVELPSPYAGYVQALLVQEGETVDVGTPIIRVGDTAGSEEDPDASAEKPAESAGAVVVEEEQPLTLVGSGPRTAAVARRPRFLAKPTARAAAREQGIDLADVTPARTDGVITTADLAGRHAAPTADRRRAYDVPAPVFTGRTTREPIKGVRKMMGHAMAASAFTVPHVTVWTTVDVTATMRRVEELKQDRAYDGVKVSPLLVLAQACVEALRRHPLLNALWDEDAQEVVLRHYVNLGIAAATPRGLIVPNIKDADLMGTPDLGRAITDLIGVAREGRTQPAEQQGGTFTISNIGPLGMEGGTPIINPGESAILCFGAIDKRPWVVSVDGEDRLAIRDVCTLSLSFDHRHIDGAAGSAFLADVAAQLG
ncbi:MAG: dihydrolipoamide acetyltransferase family protein [Nocardioides sp.]